MDAPRRGSGSRLLRPGEVRSLFGIAASTLLDWVKLGKIKVAQRTLGGHRRYREADIRAVLAELKAVA